MYIYILEKGSQKQEVEKVHSNTTLWMADLKNANSVSRTREFC